MNVIRLYDVTDAWGLAKESVSGLRFRTFEGRIRGLISSGEEVEGVFLVDHDVEKVAGRVYLHIDTGS
ncbi:MAG: hypothetical protein ACXABY_01665 [Candidatus Thorarchaeota archaeon]|jgi:hypothetical protein